MTETPEDRRKAFGSFGVIANVQSDRIFRTGAKVWILGCNGDASCPQARGLSKRGRQTTKYTHYKRLTNFRAAWVPDKAIGDVWATWLFEDREMAEECAALLSKAWDGVRYFNRDGSILMKDGITEGQAHNRNIAAYKARMAGKIE